MSYLITADYIQEQMNTLGLKASFSPSAYALDTLIQEASDWVENYCDRKFTVTAVSEVAYGPIRRNHRLILDDFPIVAVSSAYWEDPSGTTGTVDVSRLRTLKGGILEWKNALASSSLYSGAWYPDILYTVNYTAGYATVPSNVQRATALKIVALVQPQYQGPQDREVFMVTNLEQMIVDLLEPYRRERLG